MSRARERGPAGTILITTDYSRPDDAVDRLLAGAGHRTRYRVSFDGDDELVSALACVEGAIVANDRLNAAVLERATSLRAVVRSGVGYDSVDVGAAARLGISVSNLPGVNSNAVAEYTFGLLLAAARHLVASAEGVRAGAWPRRSGRELRGATLGLIGYGHAARAVAKLAHAFGMTVLCTTTVPEELRADPDVRFVELPELLRASHYVSLHTALTPRTHHLIDADALAAMKDTAILINTARGPVIDETALAHAVTTGLIAGAALDVTEIEPLPATSPLRGVDGITVFPHMAGQTVEAQRAAALGAAHELLAALEGHPRTPVNAHLIGELA